MWGGSSRAVWFLGSPGRRWLTAPCICLNVPGAGWVWGLALGLFRECYWGRLEWGIGYHCPPCGEKGRAQWVLGMHCGEQQVKGTEKGTNRSIYSFGGKGVGYY